MRLTLIATKVKAFQASVTSLNLLKGVYKYTAGEHGFLAGLGGGGWGSLGTQHSCRVDPIIPKLDRTSTQAHMAAQSLQFATKVKKFSILTHSLTSLNFFHAAEHPRHPCAVNMLSCFTRKRNGLGER